MPKSVDVDELRLLWLTALTSGEYQQAQSQLAMVQDDEDDDYGHPALTTHLAYCCIGVLCDVAVNIGNWKKRKPDEFRIGRSAFAAEIPQKFEPLFGLEGREQQDYIAMNDSQKLDFEAIAKAAGS